MSEQSRPDLQYLIHEIETKFGRKIVTSADFETLSALLQESSKQVISVSTLKRIWGSVSLSPIPRTSTLDILASYIGYDAYRSFCEDLMKKNLIESGFFETKSLSVSDLSPDDTVEITWAPNRLVLLRYLGNFRFEVVKSENSKLEAGDRFEASNILVGYPLYISRILRNGEYTPSFIAGQSAGISTIKVN